MFPLFASVGHGNCYLPGVDALRDLRFFVGLQMDLFESGALTNRNRNGRFKIGEIAVYNLLMRCPGR